MVRCISVLFASLMLLISVFAVVTGDLESGPPPPFIERLWGAGPSIVMFCSLVLPYRAIRWRWLFWMILAVLILAATRFVCQLPEDFQGYRDGRKSWEIIPVSIGTVGLFIANALTLIAIVRRKSASA